MKLTVVTAASSNHYAPLVNLLWTVRHFEPETRVVVFDLGLTNAERLSIEATRYELRTFPFALMPTWARDLRKYAWKAVCVATVAHELPDNEGVLWCDAGNLFAGPARKIRGVMEIQGYYCPEDFGTLGGWTHELSRQAMGMTASEEELPMRSTALCGIHMRMRGLAEQWREWSLMETVIAPEGSAKRNHRHDMSIFSLLAHRWAPSVGPSSLKWFEVTKHHDNRTFEQVKERALAGKSYYQFDD